MFLPSEPPVGEVGGGGGAVAAKGQVAGVAAGYFDPAAVAQGAGAAQVVIEQVVEGAAAARQLDA